MWWGVLHRLQEKIGFWLLHTDTQAVFSFRFPLPKLCSATAVPTKKSQSLLVRVTVSLSAELFVPVSVSLSQVAD